MLVEALQTQSGLSRKQLNWFATTASKRYKVYQIPKQNGTFRTIEQPSQEIKAIQRWIILYLIKKLPIHDSATAYKDGSSIRQNAIRHASSQFTLHVDFKDFFPHLNIKILLNL